MHPKQSLIIGCKKITSPELTVEVMLQQNPEDTELWLEKGYSEHWLYQRPMKAPEQALSK